MAIVFINNSMAYLQSFENASFFCLVISPDFLELSKNQTKVKCCSFVHYSNIFQSVLNTEAANVSVKCDINTLGFVGAYYLFHESFSLDMA